MCTCRCMGLNRNLTNFFLLINVWHFQGRHILKTIYIYIIFIQLNNKAEEKYFLLLCSQDHSILPELEIISKLSYWLLGQCSRGQEFYLSPFFGQVLF